MLLSHSPAISLWHESRPAAALRATAEATQKLGSPLLLENCIAFSVLGASSGNTVGSNDMVQSWNSELCEMEHMPCGDKNRQEDHVKSFPITTKHHARVGSHRTHLARRFHAAASFFCASVAVARSSSLTTPLSTNTSLACCDRFRRFLTRSATDGFRGRYLNMDKEV